MKYIGKYKKMAEQIQKDGCDGYMIEKFIQQENDAVEYTKNEGTTDVETVRLWKSYSDETKQMWLNNAFCINCGKALFRPEYNLRKDKFGLVIKGFCDTRRERIVRCCD